MQDLVGITILKEAAREFPASVLTWPVLPDTKKLLIETLHVARSIHYSIVLTS